MSSEYDLVYEELKLAVESQSEEKSLLEELTKESKSTEELKESQIPDKVLNEDKTESLKSNKGAKGHKRWHGRIGRMLEPLFKQDIEIKTNTFEKAYDRLEHKMHKLKYIRSIIDQHTQRLHTTVNVLADTMTAKFLSDLDEFSKENQRRNVQMLESVRNGVFRYTWIR